MIPTPLHRFEQSLSAIELRVEAEPRLERYRVAGEGANGVEGVPDGWFVSRAIERLACTGGFWPGWFAYPVDQTKLVAEILGVDDVLRGVEPAVRWAEVGSVWERDHFYTPMLPWQVDTAPLLGFSSQGLWVSMVFPHEAAMLESFVITYDGLGLDDENGEVDPFFVEWVTQPPLMPPEHDPQWAERRQVHENIAAASRGWSTDHRCWIDSEMPRLDDDLFPEHLAAALLGLDLS